MAIQTDELASEVHYHVAVHPDQHEIEVTVHLRGSVAEGRMRLEIPTWVPGDYSFAKLGRDLFEVHAKDATTGAVLNVTRDGWQAFHIDGGTGNVLVTYKAWAYVIEFAEPSGIIDSTYGILLGARYLHSPQYLGACTVTYTLPEAWKGTIHHPSGATQKGPSTWLYPSFEILLDTPVIMGRYDKLVRNVRGTNFYFVFVDRGIGFEAEAESFVDKVAATAENMFDIFGSFPFSDYTFVLSLNPAATWGLEHLTSTMCGLGPEVFTDPDQYAIGVRVCAHELFHAWNVRRLRPAPLLHLDKQLTKGSFSEGLWVAEGFTRYYEFVTSTRAGVYTIEQFFSNIVGYFEHLGAVPAYERVSCVDSSLSTYLTHSPKYPGRTSNSIDYYDKGMLIAFSIDASLRSLTANDSLDSAFCAFYEKYVSGGPEYSGFTTDDAIRFFEGRLAALGPMLDASVRRPGGLVIEALLEQLGFQVNHTETHELGIVFLNNGAPTLYNVLDDSPAGHSGLAPQDVITAVNGFAHTASGLRWAAAKAAPVTLDVTRGHRHLSFTITPVARKKITALTWKGNDVQTQRLAAWLGQTIHQGRSFQTNFYENFHGIETVL